MEKNKKARINVEIDMSDNDRVVLVRFNDAQMMELDKWTASVLITTVVAFIVVFVVSIVLRVYATVEDVAVMLMFIAAALLIITPRLRREMIAACIERDSVTIMKGSFTRMMSFSGVRYGIDEVVMCLRDVFLHVKYPGGEVDFPVTPKVIERLEQVLGSEIKGCVG